MPLELEDWRETLPEEREELLPDEERDALLPEVEERRFCWLTEAEGREALEEDLDTLEEERPALEDGRETLPEERDALPDERETLPPERLAPALYVERPALEDRETEDELRLGADDEERPPPLRDWAKAVPEDNASAATTVATQAILKILFISANYV